jgi:hypothetical protein
LKIIIEFYKPGTTTALARWDFPIRYDGNGVDEMWIDRTFFEGSFAKAAPPPPGCLYRVLLLPGPSAPRCPASPTPAFSRSMASLPGKPAP